MRERFIISIPLVASDETTYNVNRDKRIQKQLDALETRADDHETMDLVRRHLGLLDPYCYPYNATVAFAEIWIDSADVLVNYIFNGDGRRVYNRFKKGFRPNPGKYYNTIQLRAAGRFYNFTNLEVTKAIIKTLDEVFKQCKKWKITFDIDYYKRLLCSTNYKKLLST
jgi:hypothetical protein